MAIKDVETKCYILALFIRSDGARFLLGSGAFEFKDSQQHFSANTMANDVVEVQGNDGYLLAGQVRRPGVQSFDGYVGDAGTSKPAVESLRRDFFQFFRKGYFYKVVYVFPDGSAIQRKRGFLVDAPVVQELYQIYPEYHVALNFEDINYYFYDENAEGEEIYGKSAIVGLSMATGGLVWDNDGAVTDPLVFGGVVTVKGAETINNLLNVAVPLASVGLYGDTYQQTYSGKNLFNQGQYGSSVSNFGLTASFTPEEVTLAGTSQADTWPSYTMYADGHLEATKYWPTDSQIVTSRGQFNDEGTYRFTIYADGTRGTEDNAFRYLIGYMDGTFENRYFPRTDKSQNIAITKPINFVAFGVVPSTAFDLKLKFQLEPGSSATSFEPYVGGIPSPNPDYPQEIQTVTGKQTVMVRGKNLLDTIDGFRNGYLNTTTGAFVSSNTSATFDNYVPVNAGDIYTFTRFGSAYQCSIYAFKSDGSYHGRIVNFFHSDDPYWTETFTIPSGVSRLVVGCNIDNSSTVTQAMIDDAKFQLEKGDVATDYEGDKGQSYLIDLRGTNLLNLADFAIGGMSSGNPQPATKYRINNGAHPIEVNPNTAYTISAQLVSPVQGFRVGIHECRADGTFISDLGWQQLATSAYTFTTSSNTGMVKIVGSLSVTSSNVSTGGTEDTTTYDTVSDFMRDCTLMLEEGSSATAYQPYNPIELCKIGESQDYIYKSGDDWYVHKEIKKVIYDGSEEWTRSTNAGTNNFYVLDDEAALVGNFSIPPIFSNMFTRKILSDCWNSGNEFNAISMYNLSGQIRVFFPQSLANTVGAFKSWLNTHNVMAYFALATPTDTQITDTTLIGQLNALGSANLYAGENNLLVMASGTNLPAELEVGYYTEFGDGYGFVWEEGHSPSNIIVVDSVDDVFPVLTITGETVNPVLANVTTGTVLQYNGTVTASQTLVIDMMAQTATLNGVSVIGNISGDWISFAPGNNRVSYSASNADAPDATIKWQEIVG